MEQHPSELQELRHQIQHNTLLGFASTISVIAARRLFDFYQRPSLDLERRPVLDSGSDPQHAVFPPRLHSR